MSARPVVAVTIGDPAGVGPEVVVKSLASPEIFEVVRPLVVGDCDVVERARCCCGLGVKIRPVTWPGEGLYVAGSIDVLDVGSVDVGVLDIGQVQAVAGQAAYDYIRKAVELALAGDVDAIATAPINKEALRAARIPYLDHTEMLAGLTNSPDPLTMFIVRGLRIFFLTRHVPLRLACERIDYSMVLDGVLKVDTALKRFGSSHAHIAVAALNPHGGESGLFGDEESREIEPAIREARARGVRVSGPIPADSVFHLALRGQFDAVLSLYHDQGHIAAKTLDFERTVAITTGLPFVRSSVDHGTAFNIAGKGIASAVSMVEAIRAAGEYAERFVGSRPGD